MNWHEQWIVVTDLDGTLLDHDDYSWRPAAGAVELLKAHAVPLVLSSSKTLAEMRELSSELGLHAPLIVENGAAIAWPEGGDYRVEVLGRPREEVVHAADVLRQQHGYRYEGYAEWAAEDVSRHTGLPIHKAVLSHDRHGTEPILWNGSDEELERFIEQLAQQQIRALRGGRFIHLMGDFDKADGVRLVRDHLSGQMAGQLKVLALGDSPNDAAMLSAADVAVRIRSAKSSPMTIHAPILLQPEQPGPTGWSSAVHQWWAAQGTPETQNNG